MTNPQSRDFVVRIMTVFLGVLVSMITITLCIRVLEDGNSALVADLTGKLAWVVMGSIAAIVALVTGHDLITNSNNSPPTTPPAA